MKQFVLAIILVFLGHTPQPAEAGQDATGRYGQGFGKMYLAWDVSLDPWQSALASCNDYPANPIPPLSPFEWVLVISLDFGDIGRANLNGSNGLQAWEASVSIPDELTVTQRTLRPSTSVDVLGPVEGDPNDDNWIVGTGQLVAAAQTPFVLVQYRGMFLSVAMNKTIRVGPASPSSFTEVGGPGPVPGWVEWDKTGECPNVCLRAFPHWEDCRVSLAINSMVPCEGRCGLGVEASSSWGALKARY